MEFEVRYFHLIFLSFHDFYNPKTGLRHRNCHTQGQLHSNRHSTIGDCPFSARVYNPRPRLHSFFQGTRELQVSSYLTYLIFAYFKNSTRNGKPVLVDGQTLSIAAVTAASRYHASVSLDESPVLKAKIAKSRKVMADKVDAGLSVYGVSTGFGGSADTRTDEPILLGNALLQHQQSGVLPSSMKALDVLPLQDPLSATSMPESWVRGAILIRMNSLIRGHSGVRWELIERMRQLLRANITPLVPLYGTISASGGKSFT